jgi:hypothetical protein
MKPVSNLDKYTHVKVLRDPQSHVILNLVLFNNPIFEVSYPERWRDRPYETAATPLNGKVPSPTDVVSGR